MGWFAESTRIRGVVVGCGPLMQKLVCVTQSVRTGVGAGRVVFLFLERGVLIVWSRSELHVAARQSSLHLLHYSSAW